MNSMKGPEGLRDSVFKAIISDRISMSPPPKERPSTVRNLPRAGSTSISFRDICDDEVSRPKYRLNPALTAKSVSLESLRMVPTVTVEPPPPEHKIRKAPSTKDVTDVDKKLMIEWLRCCRKGDVARCETLLEKTPSLANYVPPYFLNLAAIHIAVVGKHYDLIHLLRSYGADLNAQTLTGYTALHLAAQKEDKETLKLLLALGADRSIRDVLGYTYHHYAPWLNRDEDLESVIRLRDKSSSRPPRPLSQVSADSTMSSDSGLLRQGSFRSALRKLVVVPSFRRSPSPF